jgi:hypothetical protein
MTARLPRLRHCRATRRPVGHGRWRLPGQPEVVMPYRKPRDGGDLHVKPEAALASVSIPCDELATPWKALGRGLHARREAARSDRTGQIGRVDKTVRRWSPWRAVPELAAAVVQWPAAVKRGTGPDGFARFTSIALNWCEVAEDVLNLARSIPSSPSAGLRSSARCFDSEGGGARPWREIRDTAPARGRRGNASHRLQRRARQMRRVATIRVSPV